MAERSHFHSSPEPNAARKAYLIKGDRVEVTAVHGEWYQVSFSGPKATTTGWMSASAFSEHNVKGALHGTWISKIGQPYSVFYRFYPDNRYKTWDINSFEPQAMTGKYRVEPSGEISLAPCGESGQSIRYKEPSDGELAMMLPGTNTWTAFEKRTEPGDLEQAAFSIEKRRIKTTVNNRIHYIPSSGSKEQFLRAVCPFYVSSGVLLRGEGEFPILTVSTFDKIPLFDAIVDNDQVTGLVIRDKRINFAGISIGSTFMELRRAIPAAAVTRSEMEGRIVGSTEDFSYSFGHSLLFNDSVKTLPDTVTIKEIVL